VASISNNSHENQVGKFLTLPDIQVDLEFPRGNSPGYMPRIITDGLVLSVFWRCGHNCSFVLSVSAVWTSYNATYKVYRRKKILRLQSTTFYQPREKLSQIINGHKQNSNATCSCFGLIITYNSSYSFDSRGLHVRALDSPLSYWGPEV